MPHPGLLVPATFARLADGAAGPPGLGRQGGCAAGAAIGREFSYALLACATEVPEPQLGEALERLSNAGLVFARGTPPHASYLFKHALVQDAAYGTLLRGRKQKLHRKIAEMIEARFPDEVETRAEVLAHHFTEAAQIERAVGYWMKAGRRALMRSGMAEAEALLRKGLTLLAGLPDGVRRQECELDLQIALGQGPNGNAWLRCPGRRRCLRARTSPL